MGCWEASGKAPEVGSLGGIQRTVRNLGASWGPRGKGRAWDPVSSQEGVLL